MTRPNLRSRFTDVAPAVPSVAGDGSDFPDRPAQPARLTLSRRAATEALGTGLLVATVVGSGIMGEPPGTRVEPVPAERPWRP